MGNPNIKKSGEKTRFSSSNQPATRGRKKNKFNYLKDQYELSSSDVNNIIVYLSSLTLSELRDIAQNEKTSSIIIAYASAILSSIKNGELNNIEMMLNRSIGKPSENVNLKSDLPIKINVIGIKPSDS